MEPTEYFDQKQISHTVKRLLDEAKLERGEQRAHTRQPFFGPVTIVVQENGQQRNFSCFSRDISPSGMGLLHNMPLKLGRVTLVIPRESAGIHLQSEIMWCQPCGEGWYLSGASFLAVSPPH